jgi:16S rRNA (cytosine967-C5)-methyltransferase
MSLVRRACERTGVTNALFHVADFRRFAESFSGAVDRCLIDAPCSGTGALRRKPDLRWRLKAEEVIELARLQFELLESAAGIIRPGGVILYSTCSLEPEENESVVRSFLSRHEEFASDPPSNLSVPPDQDGFVRTLPHKHSTDGMFIARLVRTI